MERQFASDAKKAESQFTVYLSNPQRWARYTYGLNNPLLYTDPHGEDVTIYYRPAREGAGSTEDYGHILIYVRNDETGESAYYDYIATGDYNNFGTTQLNGVDQKRIGWGIGVLAIVGFSVYLLLRAADSSLSRLNEAKKVRTTTGV